ncbi:hypothetical protein, partial [Micromonospora aurantiaca (nom. illeg.)]|uniref:hypothetical protein n=1 Tax=Micromonospora aurantiaca (nom. illeg.) TaxID=47850 RepID=UPI0016570605
MTDSLGRRLAATTDAEEWLAVEDEAGAGKRFAAVDGLLAAVTSAAFAGKPPVRVTAAGATRALTLRHVPASARAALKEGFDLATQQAAGAWWLPESAPIKPGTVNLPAYYAIEPQWAMNTAATDAVRVEFGGSPDALASWALLIPFANALYAPLILRGPDAGALEPAARDASWAAVDALYTALGLASENVRSTLTRMRPGNGWSQLPTAEQIATKVALLDALRQVVGRQTVRRWRAEVLRPLVRRYYAKANKDAPTARVVLTKALQPATAAYFGGNWLALLDYLGEAVAASEEITTALPEPRLYVQASAKVEQVAAEKNLPVAEVAKILASYLGTDEIRSPIQRRLDVLRRYWTAFDTVHARQASGMPAPPDLTPGRGFDIGKDVPFTRPDLERVLPPAVLADIEALWNGACVPRYPDRIVSALFPHAEMVAAFGPALTFWNNIALTCWFYCEGPYSRTDIDGAAEFYSRSVKALAAADTPVDPQLFADLRAAQQRLGPPQELWADRRVLEAGPGVSITMSMGGGVRRDGFEILRDIVTTHRRAWAAQNLETALNRAWEEPLRELARQVNLAVARRGKLPTLKQFATLGAPVANAWFGGDLAALYAAVGERAPVEQTRVQLMPYDRAAFCNQVFTDLGGRYVPNSRAVEDIEGNRLSWDLRRLAAEAPRFVQLEEALDRPPTPEEFGAARLTWPTTVPFNRYAAAVRQVRAGLDTVRQTSTTTEQAASRVAGTEPTITSVGPPASASPPARMAPLGRSWESTGQAAPARHAPEQ